MALASGTQCFVQCKDSHQWLGGTTAFACTAGTLKVPTLQCKPKPCIIVDASQMRTNFSWEPTDPCPANNGLIPSGSSCAVRCSSGFVSTSLGAVSAYACTAGQLSVPTLQCKPAPCHLPLQLGDGTQSQRRRDSDGICRAGLMG